MTRFIRMIFLGALVVSGCAPRQQMKALIHMIDQQERYFEREVLPPFEKENRVDIDVIHIDDLDRIEPYITEYRNQAGLVKIPFSKSLPLVEGRQLLSVNTVLSRQELEQFQEEYLLTSLGKYGEKQYLVPRKFETRIMVYLKSKVRDAVVNWKDFEENISTELRNYNGVGLPLDYRLEEDPNQWDYFDVFVAGWVWAHLPYDQRTVPRIAHRGRKYSGTALRVIDRVFQCGGDSANVLCMRGDAVVDAFEWEAVYAASGIYNERMWNEQWSGVGVWEGFGSGDVFLSFMTQLDCFFIHGTGQDSLEGYLENPDDMGCAVMPRGCSLALDQDRKPLRSGRRAITTGGWWWGIPASAPDPALSWKLITHITSTTNQIQESGRFGMIPVRKEILGDMSLMFGGGWVSRIYDASFRQLMENRNTVLPAHSRFDEISNCYLDGWFDIVAKKNWGGEYPDRAHIRKVLENRYASMAQRLAGCPAGP